MRLFGFFIVMLAVVFVFSADAETLPATSEGQIFTVLPAVQEAEVPASVPTPLANQIDQNQPSASAYVTGFSQSCLAQSFEQTHTNISGAGIRLEPSIGNTDTVTVQLWANGLPNASGTKLTEATAIGTAGRWVDVY
jgi:hypothetical protein